jgi:hypothetical protein
MPEGPWEKIILRSDTAVEELLDYFYLDRETVKFYKACFIYVYFIIV